jgi:hypothetical protein
MRDARGRVWSVTGITGEDTSNNFTEGLKK